MFVAVCTVDDVPDGAQKAVLVQERPVLLVNVGGAIHAIDAICPHASAPLVNGSLEGPVLTCPLHGWQFDVTTGQGKWPPDVCLDRFEVRIEGGSVLVQTEPA